MPEIPDYQFVDLTNKILITEFIKEKILKAIYF
jgi:hypothetical protein